MNKMYSVCVCVFVRKGSTRHFCSPLTDSRLHAFLLVSETQPEVQAQAADQQHHQPREASSHFFFTPPPNDIVTSTR